jgi:hypothetical protein
MISLDAIWIFTHGCASHQFAGVSSGSVYRIVFRRLNPDNTVLTIPKKNELLMKPYRTVES